MDPNHRDRIAFARLCSGKLTRGMKVKLVRTGKIDVAQRAAVLLRPGPLARRRGLSPATWSASPTTARLRIGDTLTEGEEIDFRRRAELRAGNPAPRAAARRHEGEEAEGGAAADGGGGRGPGVPPARRRAGAGRRGRPAAARRAAGAARRTNTASKSVVGHSRVRSSPAGSPATTPRCWRSSSPNNGLSIADDLDGDLVYLARNEFYLDYTRERAPGIVFTDVKDRHAGR